jgi:hypothetical protein
MGDECFASVEAADLDNGDAADSRLDELRCRLKRINGRFGRMDGHGHRRTPTNGGLPVENPVEVGPQSSQTMSLDLHLYCGRGGI